MVTKQPDPGGAGRGDPLAQISRNAFAFIQAISQATSDALFLKDLEGRYFDGNRRVAELLGIPIEAARGKTARDLFPPEEAERIERAEREALQTGRTVVSQDRVTIGGRSWVFSTARSPIRDGQGVVRGLLCVARDVTEYVRANDALRESEERFRRTFEDAPIGMALLEVDGTILQANGRLCAILQRSAEELSGRTLSSFSHPRDAELDRVEIGRLLRGELDRVQLEKRYLHPDGGVVHGLVRISLNRDAAGRPLHVIKQVVDITARKQAEEALEARAEQLRALALVDGHTGLYNRRGFLELSERHLENARRQGRGVTLLFADVDGLKRVNDEQGHEAGDQLLADAARVIRSCFRAADVIGRLGGDEFAVTAIQRSPPLSKEVLVGRLELAVRQFNRKETRPWQLSISVGAVDWNPAAPLRLDELLQQADTLMYAAKRARKAARTA